MLSPMSLARAAIVLCMFAIGNVKHSEAGRKCSTSESRQAVRELNRVTDWQDLYNSFKHFAKCDSQKVAEEYSYTLSRLLAHKWGSLDALLRLTAHDLDFKEFIHRHIDENIPEEESQLIMRNAREHCPSDGEWLCRLITDY